MWELVDLWDCQPYCEFYNIHPYNCCISWKLAVHYFIFCCILETTLQLQFQFDYYLDYWMSFDCCDLRADKICLKLGGFLGWSLERATPTLGSTLTRTQACQLWRHSMMLLSHTTKLRGILDYLILLSLNMDQVKCHHFHTITLSVINSVQFPIRTM